MNGFTKKSVGTLTLGEKLKKIRSERRISLSDVSRFTKIQLKYLEYIEEGIYDKLPADVYVKGFLKSYAEYLNIDERILVRSFEKEKEIKKNLSIFKNSKENIKRKLKIPEPLKINSFIFTPKIITISLVSVLILASFIYLYLEVGSFAGVPKLVVLSPEQNAQVFNNSVLVEGVTERDARIYINSQPILVNDDGKFRENLILQPGTNSISVKAINRFDKEVEESIIIQAIFEEKIEPIEKNKKSESGERAHNLALPLEIEIRINPGPVWVSIEADGNLVFSGTMLSGAIQTFSAKERILIDSGKANATFIKFNGKDLGALGESSKAIKDILFTKDTKY